MDGLNLLSKALDWESKAMKNKNIPLYALWLAIDHFTNSGSENIRWSDDNKEIEGCKVSFTLKNTPEVKKQLVEVYTLYRRKNGYTSACKNWYNLNRTILNYGKFHFNKEMVYVMIPNFFSTSTRKDLYLLKDRNINEKRGTGKINPKYKSFKN